MVKIQDSSIKKEEKKFLHQVLGPKNISEGFSFHLRSNKAFYKRVEMITTIMKKRRLAFIYSWREWTQKLTDKNLLFSRSGNLIPSGVKKCTKKERWSWLTTCSKPQNIFVKNNIRLKNLWRECKEKCVSMRINHGRFVYL